MSPRRLGSGRASAGASPRMYAATGDAIGTVRPALALLGARPTADRLLRDSPAPGLTGGNTRLRAAGDRPLLVGLWNPDAIDPTALDRTLPIRAGDADGDRAKALLRALDARE